MNTKKIIKEGTVGTFIVTEKEMKICVTGIVLDIFANSARFGELIYHIMDINGICNDFKEVELDLTAPPVDEGISALLQEWKAFYSKKDDVEMELHNAQRAYDRIVNNMDEKLIEIFRASERNKYINSKLTEQYALRVLREFAEEKKFGPVDDVSFEVKIYNIGEIEIFSVLIKCIKVIDSYVNEDDYLFVKDEKIYLETQKARDSYNKNLSLNRLDFPNLESKKYIFNEILEVGPSPEITLSYVSNLVVSVPCNITVQQFTDVINEIL